MQGSTHSNGRSVQTDPKGDRMPYVHDKLTAFGLFAFQKGLREKQPYKVVEIEGWTSFAPRNKSVPVVGSVYRTEITTILFTGKAALAVQRKRFGNKKIFWPNLGHARRIPVMRKVFQPVAVELRGLFEYTDTSDSGCGDKFRCSLWVKYPSGVERIDYQIDPSGNISGCKAIADVPRPITRWARAK